MLDRREEREEAQRDSEESAAAAAPSMAHECAEDGSRRNDDRTELVPDRSSRLAAWSDSRVTEHVWPESDRATQTTVAIEAVISDESTDQKQAPCDPAADPMPAFEPIEDRKSRRACP